MFPVLIRFGNTSDTALGAYSTALVIALTVAIGLGVRAAGRSGLPRYRVLMCMIAAGLATLPGARLWHFLLHPGVYAEDPNLVFRMSAVGLGLFGGAAFGSLLGMLCAWWLKLPFRILADAVMPGMLIAAAILKVGCFSQGCCYGSFTSLPWGIRFPLSSPAGIHQTTQNPLTLLTGTLPVNPVQLYEAVAYLLASAIVTRWTRRQPPGTRGAWCVLAMASVHFVGLQMRDLTGQPVAAVNLSLLADALVILSGTLAITEAMYGSGFFSAWFRGNT
jgi:phosphatidylglycerol:prolipoprotein diacylglycerol transferase